MSGRKLYACLCCLLLLIFISSCRHNSEEKLESLVKALSSPDKGIRNSSALDIARFGKDGHKAVPGLIKLLNSDPSRGIRTSAAFALRSIDTPEAIKALDSYSE